MIQVGYLVILIYIKSINTHHLIYIVFKYLLSAVIFVYLIF